MDPRRFDLLVRSLSSAHPRRGLLAWLAGVPFLSGLLGLRVPATVEAGGRRKRRKVRHKRRRSKRERSRQRSRRQTQRKRKKRGKRCSAQPRAVTCQDTCGIVRNNCNQPVDCGECPGEPQSCTSNADCSGDTPDCCGSPGTCVNTQTNPHHCGDCFDPCESNEVCWQGMCSCGDVCSGEGCQFQSIEEAVASAPSGSTIRICPGTYDAFGISRDVTIIGAGDGDDDSSNTIVESSDNGNVVSVSGGARATLQSLRITGGSSPDNGGGVNNTATLTLIDCTVTDNSASAGGGGIYNAGTLTLTSCDVTDNSGSDGGGGIFNDEHGAVALTDCRITGNSTNNQGGGVYNANPDGNAITADSKTQICGNSPDQCMGNLSPALSVKCGTPCS